LQIVEIDQLDFDEFNFRDLQKVPIDWRNSQPESLPDSCPDCKVIVNGGAKECSMHLDVARCSSKFFFHVASY
jgi:hypothetical protein